MQKTKPILSDLNISTLVPREWERTATTAWNTGKWSWNWNPCTPGCSWTCQGWRPSRGSRSWWDLRLPRKLPTIRWRTRNRSIQGMANIGGMCPEVRTPATLKRSLKDLQPEIWRKKMAYFVCHFEDGDQTSYNKFTDYRTMSQTQKKQVLTVFLGQR